jgi:arylsulfate sulfotransferase
VRIDLRDCFAFSLRKYFAPLSIERIAGAASKAACLGIFSLMLTSCGHSFTAVENAASSSVPSAALSATSFDFGANLVNNTLTQSVAVVTNTGTTALTMNPVISGDASFSIVAAESCGTSLAPSGSCQLVVSYTPVTASSSPKVQTARLLLNFAGVVSGTPGAVQLSGSAAVMPVGQVTPTGNPQVALYTMTLPFPASVAVQFGTTTNYGLTTWSQPTTLPNNQVSMFVAGMLANTTYHMAALVKFSNGITVTDSDHTFTTGAPPWFVTYSLTASTSPGMTPQSGLEMLDTLGTLAVTDLSGNVLWAFANPGGNSVQSNIQGVKLLPNGDILMAIGLNSSVPLTGALSPEAYNEILEVDLAGDTVRNFTIRELNDELATATCAECNVTLQTFHHEITVLPNGHWLVLANTLESLSSATQPPLTNEPAQAVLGDVIVDLDENLRPVWAWNEFNHLDPNHHPMGFPDWTHTNAILYSSDDGNLLVSMRHQNWVVKVDYENGSGTGKVLWRLGQGGDFTLQGGTDPTDWNYAQHLPAFFSATTAGVFNLGMMDNGDDRIFPANVTCGTSGNPPCLYSTVPIFQIDETARTANLIFHQVVPAAQYNAWGGNAEPLDNGDVEYDLCGVGGGSYVYEVTQTANPQTVWSLSVTGSNLYRAFRIPSLYPGVQW